LASPASGVGAGRGWRAVAWTTLIVNALVAVLFAAPAAMILSVGLSAASKTEGPEQYGAAMMFALIGALCGILAILAAALAVASWFVCRRLRQRPVGKGTVAFFALAGVPPLALLVYAVFFP